LGKVKRKAPLKRYMHNMHGGTEFQELGVELARGHFVLEQ
jgi:hypothetical protein